jgi:hypothetical protein
MGGRRPTETKPVGSALSRTRDLKLDGQPTLGELAPSAAGGIRLEKLKIVGKIWKSTAFQLWYIVCLRCGHGRNEGTGSPPEGPSPKYAVAGFTWGDLMDISAFDTLVVPVLLTTLSSCVLGATILGLTNAIETLVDRALRAARTFKTPQRPASAPHRRLNRRGTRGAGSIV